MAQWQTICLSIQEMQVQTLGQEDPLEKGMATHSGILAWRIPRIKESGGLQSMGSERGGRDWAHTQACKISTWSIWQLVHKSSTNRYHFSISCLLWIPSIISFFLIAWLEPLVKCWLEEAENSHFRLENSHFLISNLLQSYSNSDSIVQV